MECSPTPTKEMKLTEMETKMEKETTTSVAKNKRAMTMMETAKVVRTTTMETMTTTMTMSGVAQGPLVLFGKAHRTRDQIEEW
jgi:hypothetical protein